MVLKLADENLRHILSKSGIPRQLRFWRGQSLRVMRVWGRSLSRLASRERQDNPCRIHAMRAGALPTWFGYYDKTPFSSDDNYILAAAMVCKEDWSKKAVCMPLKLGFFEWSEVVAGRVNFRQFAQTSTWSWQQASMLHWFPRSPDRLVLYNTLVDGRYGSVIQDVHSREIVMSNRMPIYATEPHGRWGLSLNFSRLERLRPGYGYNNRPDETMSDPCPGNDGISRIDFDSGNHQMLLSLRDIANFKTLPSMKGSLHYVNHLLFSPNGNRFVFLHLWLSGGRRCNRLMLYDLESGNLRVLDDQATVSHFAWISVNQLLAFRIPFTGTVGYYAYSLDSNDATKYAALLDRMPSQDGHPSLSPSGEVVVADTYPDMAGDQDLYLYSLRTGTSVRVGTFFSPFRYRGELRCDLHPRWDRSGTRICFDSTYQGIRSICVAEVDVASRLVESIDSAEVLKH